MNKSTTKSRVFVIAIPSIALGFIIAVFFTPTSTVEYSQKHNQLDTQLRILEKKLSKIDDTLNQLIEQNETDNLTISLDSTDEENMTSANLKKILKEVIHEELNVDSQNDIASNEDTTRAWELISQVQGTEITADFFQSKEVNALPAKQKELVISEIIGMMNRGEIDADQFFGIE